MIEPNTEVLNSEQLDEDMLQAIGKRLTVEKTFAPPIHKDIQIRWHEIYKAGLPKEEKVELFKKYSQAENCAFLEAPKLNMEIKVTLQEPVVARDTRLISKQEKVSVVLAALSSALSSLLNNEDVETTKMVEKISDSCRILVDLQRDESLTRRSLILANNNINPTLKDTLNSTEIDEWLFGKQLEDRIKAAKLLEKSSKDLKPAPKTYVKTDTKNYRRPLRPSNKPYENYRNRPRSGQFKQSHNQNHLQKPPLSKDKDYKRKKH